MTNNGSLRVLSAALALLLSLFLPASTHAQKTLMIKADDQFQFAERYFSTGQYYRAVGEYERFIHFFPQEPRVPLAMYKVGLSYQKGERFTQALQAFRTLIEKYGASEFAKKAYVRMSESYVKLNQFDNALSALEGLLRQTPDLHVKDEAYYKQGWIYLEMEEWEKAQVSFDRISPQNKATYRLKELSTDMDKRQFLKHKNPSTAGGLALVPGAGHLYCERYRDALIAFLLNGAMIYAAYEAFDHDNEALGGLITFFELGLYSGNIYSAVSSAHKYNRKQKRDFFQYLQKHSFLKASAGTVAKGQALVLSYKIAF